MTVNKALKDIFKKHNDPIIIEAPRFDFMKGATPTNGSMTFEGRAGDIFHSLHKLLNNERVRIHVEWDVIEEDGTVEAKPEYVEDLDGFGGLVEEG